MIRNSDKGISCCLLLRMDIPDIRDEEEDLCADDNESESGQAKRKRKKKNKDKSPHPKKKARKKKDASDSAPSDVEKPVAKAKAKGKAKAKAKAKSETKAEAKAKASVKPAKKPFVHIGETMAAKKKRIQGELADLKAMGPGKTDTEEEARQLAMKAKLVFWMHQSDSLLTLTQSVSQSVRQTVRQSNSQSVSVIVSCRQLSGQSVSQSVSQLVNLWSLLSSFNHLDHSHCQLSLSLVTCHCQLQAVSLL